MNDPRHPPPSADGAPDSWVRGTADDGTEEAAPQAVQGGDAAEAALAVRDDWEQRYRDVEVKL